MASPNRYRLPFEAPILEMEAGLAELESRYADIRNSAQPEAAALSEQIRRVRRELGSLTRTIYANLSAWETVLVSRCDARPQTRDYLNLIFDQFIELHG